MMPISISGVTFVTSTRDEPEEFFAPENVSPPSINGETVEGETLVATTGSWNNGGAPIESYYYTWYRDEDIVEVDTSEYVLSSEDVGSVFRVEVIATNSVGFGVAESDPTGVIVPAATAPVNVSLPTISGVARSGENLILSSNGEWTGNGEEILDYEYQWLADNVSMPGKTGTLLALTDSEIGKRISIRVNAINSLGSTMATSHQTAAVIAAPGEPAIVTAPAITGEARSGETLTVSDGTWNNGGSPITSYTYQWFADDVALSGETAATLLLTDDHIGAVIRAEVTATNAVDSTTATTIPTNEVIPNVGIPIISTYPAVSGSSRAGKTRSVTEGVWDENGAPVTITYEWLSWDKVGEPDYQPIEGATEPSFTIPIDLIGYGLKVRVTATNIAGSASVETGAATVSNGDLPVIIEPPTISGFANVGQVLTIDKGVWSGVDFPIEEYAYQWQYRVGTAYVDLVGETGETYTIGSETEGSRIRCYVYATNACGTRARVSNVTAVVGPAFTDPENTVAPTISGTPKRTHVLTCSTGTWTAYPTITSYTYQWRADGAPLSGATSNTLVLTDDHLGAEITCVVGAVNGSSGGPFEVETAAVGPVETGDAPENTSAPVISGVVRVGFTLTATSGAWTADTPANPILSYSYQWTADGEDISGATGTTYELTENEFEKVIRVEVTAHTDVDDVVAVSDPTPAVLEFATPPVNTVLPEITPSSPDASSLLEASTGTWSDGGGTTPTYSYQWYKDGVAVSGATNSTLQLDNTYIGVIITVVVTATNDVGSDDAESAPTNPVSGSFEDESLAYFAALDVEPPHKGVINSFVVALKTAGVWGKLDRLFLMATHDKQAALVNMIDPSVELVESGAGSIGFDAYLGTVGDGVNCLDDPESVFSYTKYTRTTASYGVYITNESFGAAQVCGGTKSSSGVASFMAPRTSGTSAIATIAINSGGKSGVALPAATSQGLIIAHRDETNRKGWKDKTVLFDEAAGVSPNNDAAYETNMSTEFWRWHGRAAARSTYRIGVAFIGADLTTTEMEDFHDAIVTYLAAVAP